MNWCRENFFNILLIFIFFKMSHEFSSTPFIGNTFRFFFHQNQFFFFFIFCGFLIFRTCWITYKLGKNIKNCFFSIENRWIDSQFRLDRNELATPSYSILHFRMGTNFNLGNKKDILHLYFQINNLFNTSYFSHLSRYRLLNIPEPGRNVTVTLKFNWE